MGGYGSGRTGGRPASSAGATRLSCFQARRPRSRICRSGPKNCISPLKRAKRHAPRHPRTLRSTTEAAMPALSKNGSSASHSVSKSAKVVLGGPAYALAVAWLQSPSRWLRVRGTEGAVVLRHSGRAQPNVIHREDNSISFLHCLKNRFASRLMHHLPSVGSVISWLKLVSPAAFIADTVESPRR